MSVGGWIGVAVCGLAILSVVAGTIAGLHMEYRRAKTDREQEQRAAGCDQHTHSTFGRCRNGLTMADYLRESGAFEARTDVGTE